MSSNGSAVTTPHGYYASNVFQRQLSQNLGQIFSAATETVFVLKKQLKHGDGPSLQAAHFALSPSGKANNVPPDLERAWFDNPKDVQLETEVDTLLQFVAG